MIGQRFRKDVFLRWKGRECQITGRLPNGKFQIKHLEGGLEFAVTETELRNDLFTGELQILGTHYEYEDLKRKMSRQKAHDLTALSDDDPRKEKAKKRLNYVTEVLKKFSRNRFSDQELKEVILTVNTDIKDENPPSTKTLRRWVTQYLQLGADSRALIAAEKAKGNRRRKLGKNAEQSETLNRLILDAINEIYLTPERKTGQAVYDKVNAEVYRYNQLREPDDQLPIPSRSTIYRIINDLDEYEKDKARFGERIAEAKHRAYQRGPRPERPLERVECDDTKVDLFVIDPIYNLPLGRPTFFALIDVKTKYVLGYFLSFYQPAYLSAMQCLLHAIKPKSYVETRYQMVNNTWNSYGLMENLVVDNAKHWHCADFDDACLQLGINVLYAPVKVPWFKGSIERFFRTLNSQLLHQQPGTTFSGIVDKADYDPKKNAVISLDLLEELLHKWIIDVYHQDEHRGLRDVPARLWNIGINKYPPPLPPAHTELEVLLGKVESRTISHAGIEFQRLFYNDDSLIRLRNRLRKSEKVKFKYDPANLGLIYVYDETDGRYFPVPCTDQNYAGGLTEWQHAVIRKMSRQTVDDYIDDFALAEAKDYLQTRVKELIAARKGSTKTNVKLARWLTAQDPAEGRLVYNSPPLDSDGGDDSAETITPSAIPPKNSKKNATSKIIPFVPEETSSLRLEDVDLSEWGGDYNLPK